MSKIRIISDGVTTIVADSLGEPIENIIGIYWLAEPGKEAIAMIKLENVEVDFTVAEQGTTIVFEEAKSDEHRD